jgi:gliding motility-associated-like protein
MKSFVFKSLIVFALAFCGLSASAWATHNRAGEITVEQVGNCVVSLTVRATIVTYTKASSAQVDRDTLELLWGDGSRNRVARVNGPLDRNGQAKGELLENDTRKNIYVAIHTYPARGTYVLSMSDPNRNGGILNVNYPNSEQVKFYIQTSFTFPNPQFQGCNNTPVLLQPPIDIACVGQTFIHNPNAYDSDGDSLAYRLVVPLQDVRLPVPNYLYPNQINPGPRNNLKINEITGDIVWEAPQREGEYNLAMIIIEYRDGLPMDTVVRDMQILVKSCDNRPPVVETPFTEICVVAGKVLDFKVRATAPIDERTQKVRLTALGGPFQVKISPATFLPPAPRGIYELQPVIKTFRWATTCEHISNQYYSVIFRGVDDYIIGRDTAGLATLKTVRIKVVGPPPAGVRATPGRGNIVVSWDKPYVCEGAKDNYFRGFTVWRRIGSSSFPPDTCRPGLAGRGYEQLTPFNIRKDSLGRYIYVDTKVEQGKTYCYRIVAEFARTTPGGQYAYNLVESLPSKEICVQLNRNLPLMIQADVVKTDPTTGSIQVCWTKPKPNDLDTIANPGPYIYELIRGDGINPPDNTYKSIAKYTSNTFKNANDTCFLDTGLRTSATGYSYRVRFFTASIANAPLGTTSVASSVFLTVAPTDKANRLSWQSTTPWNNYGYVVLKKNASGGFDSLTTTTQPNYIDKNLINGKEYCYKIKSLGTYGIPGIRTPLINFSQMVCATPRDDVPPCAPKLTVETICDKPINCADATKLFNTLRWTRPTDQCPEATDVAGYNIYYATDEKSTFSKVNTINSPNQLSTEHQPPIGIAGCYRVTAFDQNVNESAPSNTICVDNCPSYRLPNTFTPNGDGKNDLFVPYPFCFIDRVDFQVFNRWGQLVFSTSDPALNWNGTNTSGDQLEDGVYYYVCRVFEQRVGGTTESKDLLKGYIELIRGK